MRSSNHIYFTIKTVILTAKQLKARALESDRLWFLSYLCHLLSAVVGKLTFLSLGVLTCKMEVIVPFFGFCED